MKNTVNRISPELIIVVDSLAFRSIERIATTIQIADTGIAPGSRIGNNRRRINLESIGVPVIAIGIPTVIHAALIAASAIEKSLEKSKCEIKENNTQYIQPILDELLEHFSGNLMVTPTLLIENAANIIAGSITASLHGSIYSEKYSLYLQ